MMSNSILKNEEFLRFRGWVATEKVEIENHTWKFFDWGPKKETPIVFLHGVTETAEVFYHQFISLVVKGYRIISVQYPEYDNYPSLCQGLGIVNNQSQKERE